MVVCDSKQIDLTDGKWSLANLGVLNQADLALVLQFCARRVGLRYDWLGIWVSCCHSMSMTTTTLSVLRPRWS